MEELLLSYLEPALSSPWLYLIVLVLATLDGFFPLVPSESVVITGGAFAAATGSPNLFLVMLAAATGAFVGDNTAYFIGRFADRRLGRWLWRSPRRWRAHEWAQRALQERGGQMILVGRFIPGGRTATSIAAGALGYERRRFRIYTGAAAAAWGTYSALLGYIGGVAFKEHPIRGMLLGMAIGAVLTLVIEVVRRVRRRFQARSGQEYTSTTRANPRSTSTSSSTGSSSPQTTRNCTSPRSTDLAIATSTRSPRRPPVTRSSNPLVPPGS